ncbi:SMC5-SMC6 complex localization factor protein 2 [Elgaria multicarinata webbii]|uniref:SMC5-SMC6 complex localization factor protein 2 n=1 Tax=Elgaria multicarinata webbii TaxID=159646 RepID=UPI002FCCBD69
MTQPLSSSNGSGGDGCTPLGFSASPSARHCKPVGRGDSAGNGRNQCITDFFKPALKEEKRNGKAEFPISCTEHPRKNLSSPKPNKRKKLPFPASNRSPIIDAFFRGARSGKKDSPDNGVYKTTKTMHPKVVVRKLFILDDSTDCSSTLKDNTCTKTLETNEKCPVRTRTPLVENSRECKMECVDSDTTGSGLSKWASTSENDSLEKESRISWCQKTGCSKVLQPGSVNSSSQLSLETICREIQVKKKMQSKPQSFASVKKSLGTSLSNQDTGDLLRKRSSLAAWESSSDESSSVQSSKAMFSSRWASDKSIIRKSQSCPSGYPNSTISLGILKHKECPGKRKRISLKMDMKNSQKSIIQKLDKHNFSSSLEKHDSKYSKGRMLSDVQLEGMNPSDKDLPISIACLDVEENGDSAYDYITNKNDQIQSEDVKESQLQTYPSRFYFKKLLPFSQEDIGVKAFSNEFIPLQENSFFPKQSEVLCSHIQDNNLLEALEMESDKRDPSFCMSDNLLLPPTSHNTFTKGKAEKTLINASTSPSQKSTEWLVSSLRDGNNILSSEDCDPVPIPRSPCDLNELNNEGSNLKACMLNSKRRSFSVSEDETSDSNLDSSDEEIFMPLEKILAPSARPSTKSPEQTSDGVGTTDTTTASHNTPLSQSSVETRVSYMTHLEHLLKEKEEFRRADELEQQLQQVEWGIEINSLSEEQPYDGKLSAEHRAFLERFSIVSDAIPDQHPGETIFQVVHAGKIFNQYNLDLRNSGFHPQNPIEKYLFGSEITQQLFVINEGLLKSAYHSSPCPFPISKWMFQMMTIHPDSSVSRKILDVLMTLTIKNASAGNDQPRPWIPSLFDIAIVLINMGVPFSALFPLQDFQPTFTEDDIMSEMHETVKKQPSGDIFGNSTPFFFLIDTNLCNMAKFLRLCISIYPEGYTDKDIFLLLLLLLKLSLEKELKQFPLVDLECLIIKLLENIREWDTKMAELCLAISYLSSHHHDLLWLVQFVPNWITRGRQVRRYLSLVIISKLLKNHGNIPSSHEEQMSLLCKDLVKMKPSNLLKRYSGTLESQAYYLTYVLLHLVREASDSDVTNASQRKWLLKLCSTLEKHVKCDIREDVRLFYRTKVKDLVARTYSKWQQMIHSSRLTQGQIHDFWDPDS